MDIAALFSSASLALQIAGGSRSDAFYEEALPVALRLTLDKSELDRERALALCKAAIGVVFELGYAEEAGRAAKRQTNAQQQAGLGVSALPPEPLTPAPLPGVAAGQASYAAVQPVAPSSFTWEAHRDGLEVQEESDRLICTFSTIANVNTPPSSLQSPLLLLTASVALQRDAQAILQATQGDENEEKAASTSIQGANPHAFAMDARLEVNLLSALGKDPLLMTKAPVLYSARLPVATLRSQYGVVSGQHDVASHGRSSSLDAGNIPPALRRSVRLVVKARSAIHARMRIIEQGPFIAIELENNSEHGYPLEVHSLQIEAKAVGVHHWPLRLQPRQQTNLLFEMPNTSRTNCDGPAKDSYSTSTPIAATMSPSRSFSRQPLPAAVEPVLLSGASHSAAPDGMRAGVQLRVLQADASAEESHGGLAMTDMFRIQVSSHNGDADLAARAHQLSTANRERSGKIGLSAPSMASRAENRSSDIVAGSRRHTAANLAAMGEARRLSQQVPLAMPAARTASMLLESPKRSTSALPLPSFGRRFFSTPSPSLPGPAASTPPPHEPMLSPPAPTPAYPPYAGPAARSTSYFDREVPARAPVGKLHVSVSLKPLRDGELGVFGHGQQPPIHVLDTFLVEIFVSNESSTVRRYTVGVPARKGRKRPHSRLRNIVDETFKRADRLERYAIVEASKAGLMPLENSVRVGPLAPNTVQSVKMRFLALQPGIHAIDELQLVEVGTGIETRLRNVLSVAIDERLPERPAKAA